MTTQTSTDLASQPWTRNAVTWFEIPVRDFERARAFYEKTLTLRLREEMMGPMRMGVFPAQAGAECGQEVTGCIIATEGYQPSLAGSIVYLNTRVDLQQALDRVRKAGGETLLPKTALPDGMGYFAQIRDTEGNRVGLYSTE